MKRTLIASLVTSVLFFIECSADIAIVTGQGQFTPGSNAITYPIANSFSIGKSFTRSIALPSGATGVIGPAVIDSYSGNIVYMGQTGDNFPLIYTGSIVSSSVNTVSFPSGTGYGFVAGAAFDFKGTAILGGQNQGIENTMPTAYRLLPWASKVTSITLPGVDSGLFDAIAVFFNNTAILVGQDYSSSSPLIYIVPEGANEGVRISLPDPSITGTLSCIAVAPDGSAILAGQDFLNNQALIYRLLPGSSSASAISIPDTNDGGAIVAVAIAPDGTAILAGQTTTSPLIYSIRMGSNAATIIANPNEDQGSLYSLAIGSDGVAILVGEDYTTNFPLIYKLSSGESEVTSIAVPASIEGSFSDVAIGSENIAVLVGGSNSINALICTMSTSDSVPSFVPISTPYLEDFFWGVAVYSCDGLYDIRRLRPYDYNEADKARNSLKKAGLR